jgi:hypothetical protein
MTTPAQKRISLEKFIKNEVPKFEIKFKEDSWLMKVLSKLLFFVDFNRFITTVYPKVYFSKETYYNMSDTGYLTVLTHEYVHLYDRKRLGQLFNLLYLSPQILALLFLALAFVSPWYLFGLLFLAPIPSIGRAWLEYRGYRATMYANHWVTGSVRFNIDSLLPLFTGPSYYFMFPFKSFMRRKFEKVQEDIHSGAPVPKELQPLEAILKTPS